MNKKFWAAVFTLAGAKVGAGILALPYVFSQSGFWIGIFWMIFLGMIIMFLNLCFGEVVLRTKTIHQIPGYAKKYLGKWGKRIMLFAMVFGIYSSLLAYLIGEGQSFSQIFTGGLKYALIFGVFFWLVMTFLLHEGLKGLKKVESWGVIIIILIIFGMLIWFMPQINYTNFNAVHYNNFFVPFGVILFALFGFSAIPELGRELKGQEKDLKGAIIFGTLISIFIYLVFVFIVIGVLGKNITEVATLSFGNIIKILGIFTMLTSYFVLSFALKDMFRFDLRLKRKYSFLLVSFVPVILYLIVGYFNLASFVVILGMSGVIAGGISAVIILIMNYKAKKIGDRKPEYKIKINKYIIIALSIIFLIGAIIELGF